MMRPSEAETKTPVQKTEYSYLKDWTSEYRASAEFELVVQKELLPVHKHVMSMSPVFERELFKTESKRSVLTSKKKKNDPVVSRMQLSTPLFLDVSVEDMCLLLSYVYATEAVLSAERMDEVRKLFNLTEEFGFPSITKRCLNFVKGLENTSQGLRTDFETSEGVATSEWLELAIKYDLDDIKDAVCDYVGENFLTIYGRSSKHETDAKWADLKMALESDLDLWKRIARRQAVCIEEGPSLASLISDEPSTTLIYGVLIGIFAGCILPSWMFFLILVGTVWYIVHRMPPAMVTVMKSTLEGAMSGIMQGESKGVSGAAVDDKNNGLRTYKSAEKSPVLRSPHVTA